MNLKSALFALPLSLILLAPCAAVADTVTLETTNNSIFPYQISVDGSKSYTTVTCLNDDRYNPIGETWNVTILNLGSLSGAQDSGQTSLKELQEAAFLDSKYNTGFAGATNAQIQAAIWDIQDPSNSLSTLEKLLVQDAIASVTGGTAEPASFYNQFTLYIPVVPVGDTDPTNPRDRYNPSNWNGNGEPQEFMAYTPAPPAVTPEPSSLLLFGTGLLGTVGMMRRRMIAAKNAA